MKIFNWEIKLRKSNSKTVEIDEKVLEQFISTDSRFSGKRPQLDPKSTIGDEEILIPLTPIPIDIIYDLARYSDVLKTIHQALRKKIFRHGYEIKENFASLCMECGKEFENQTDECDECGSHDMREPNVDQKKRLIKFTDQMNDNRQDVIKVSEEVNDDFEVIDDGYLLCITDYYSNSEGEIIMTVPVEFLRMDPRWVRLIADKKGRPGRNQNGDFMYVCPEHRNEVQINSMNCKVCGMQTLPAYYRGEEPEGKYLYYGRDEVLHKSKYAPSLTYGFSSIYSIYMKIVTLMNMDVYIKDYYSKQRPPRGLLFVDTPNMASLEKAWNWMTDMWKKNPHQIPPIAVERQNGGRGDIVNFIDFMKSPDDMQFIEMRNEYRRQIGAVYGVMPLFQADLSQGGGLNNEGLQVTVTNEAVNDGQGLFNNEVYPWIAERLGVTDYHIELMPNEEADEIHDQEVWGKKIDNAKKLQDMGFEVTMTEEEDFEYSPIDEPVEAPQTDIFGGMGGSVPGSPEDDYDDEFATPSGAGEPPSSPSAVSSSDVEGSSGEPKEVDEVEGLRDKKPEDKIKKSMTVEEETEKIKVNKEKPENQKKHKFKAAKWTHPNGHPRCIKCGDEERTGGMCEGK